MKYFFTIVIAVLMLLSCSNQTGTINDFKVTDRITRSELMQMDLEHYMLTLNELTPEVKARIWEIKAQDILDNWGLEGEELDLAKEFKAMISTTLFTSDSEKEASLALEHKYEMMLSDGHHSAVRLFLAFERPQTLAELKRLINRNDYGKYKEACRKDPHMKALLGL